MWLAEYSELFAYLLDFLTEVSFNLIFLLDQWKFVAGVPGFVVVVVVIDVAATFHLNAIRSNLLRSISVHKF